MRNGFLVECGVWVEGSSGTDLVVRDRVARLRVTPDLGLVRVVWLRSLVM
jgi:hypothetical protein